MQRQLDWEWADDLIQRIEPAIGAARAEAARERLCRPDEKNIGQRIVGRAGVGVVEDIEELGEVAERRRNLRILICRSLTTRVQNGAAEVSEMVSPPLAIDSSAIENGAHCLLGIGARFDSDFKWLKALALSFAGFDLLVEGFVVERRIQEIT